MTNTETVTADQLKKGDYVVSVDLAGNTIDFSHTPLKVDATGSSSWTGKVSILFEDAGEVSLYLPVETQVTRQVATNAYYFFKSHPVQQTHLVGPDSQLWKNATTIVTEDGVVVKTSMGDVDA